MKLSIVTTLYCSAAYINEFHKRITKAAENITDDYEIIFVNDGSPDNSLELAVELSNKDPKLKVIDLSRNFGHHKAIMTGLSYAKGTYVFLIDCDLEEEPELLNDFWKEINFTKEYDVIYGVQKSRKGGIFEKISGALFYWLFNYFSDIKIQKNLVTVRLMTRRYVEALIQFKEKEVFMAGLWCITGFDQRAFLITKLSRGSSTYDLKRKIAMLFNAITSFSSKPLLLISSLGMLITLISIFYSAYLILLKIIYKNILSGWTSVLVSVWLLGGLMIFCIGLLGIYISRIFTEVKQRPYVIIRDIYEKGSNE